MKIIHFFYLGMIIHFFLGFWPLTYIERKENKEIENPTAPYKNFGSQNIVNIDSLLEIRFNYCVLFSN